MGPPVGYHHLSAGCSAAWLARLLWEQEAAGSNPASPTAGQSQFLVFISGLAGVLAVYGLILRTPAFFISRYQARRSRSGP
jgi:hypothetical protein